MSDFKFNPKAVEPQAEVEIAPRPADSVRSVTLRTDLERISAARIRAITHSKDHNAGAYGWDHHPSHYLDFAGSQTSRWDAGILIHFANLLEVSILRRSEHVWTSNNYDARTGIFNLSDAPAVSIQELKDTLDARIVGLGLSKAKIWEHFADVREPSGREWWRVDLQTRIQKFRA